MKLFNEKLNYTVPISVTEAIQENEKPRLFIEGIAINETVTRNKRKYLGEELEKAAHTLIGKPLLKDHENKVDNIVGIVREGSYNTERKNIPFRAEIMDEHTKEMVKDGRLKNVSIGALAEEVEEDAEGNFIVKGIEFVELSLCAIPGDSDATILRTLAEKFDIQKSNEEIKMETEEVKELKEKVAKFEDLAKKTEELLSKVTKLIEQNEEDKKEKEESDKEEEEESEEESDKEEEEEKVSPKSEVPQVQEKEGKLITERVNGKLTIWREY